MLIKYYFLFVLNNKIDNKQTNKYYVLVTEFNIKQVKTVVEISKYKHNLL